MTLGHPLASWTRSAAPLQLLLGELAVQDPAHDPEALLELAARISRSVLVTPAPTLGDVNPLIERVAAAETRLGRLAVLDLVSALRCTGASIRPELELHARRGLSELARVGPPLALRMHIGFAALVYDELDVAAQIAPEIPSEFVANQYFPNDVLALLGYLIRGVRAGAVMQTFDAAWNGVAAELVQLCTSGQLDEAAVLWLARVMYQRFGGAPTERVASLAHDHLRASREHSPVPGTQPQFPLTDTLGGGAYRVEQHLRGHGNQALWLGREVATGASVLVASDMHTPEKQDVGALHRAIAYQVPDVFELAFVGTFDTTGSDRRRDADRAGVWATVEKVPGGGWLPHVLGPADPWTAPTKALELGRSAGQILVRASSAGVKLARIRPELMWAERRDNRIAVTGLSPRATELFARKVGEMVTWPLFDRFYHAPEIHQDPDDRAVAYSLAVMIAEWATGRYPFASKHAPAGVETGVHEPIDAPRPLARLLEATIRRDRDQRPRLVELVAELDRLTL